MKTNKCPGCDGPTEGPHRFSCYVGGKNQVVLPADKVGDRFVVAGVDKVFQPGPHNIFVFGSNLAGIHGAGAAYDAHQKYGANMGQGVGLMGHSYAIPTKDSRLKTLPLNLIQPYVEAFLRNAVLLPEFQFFVTRIGCGLAGYTDSQISPMFRGAPNNVELPTGWER